MGKSFAPHPQIKRRLDHILEASPADETEIVWFERRRGRAENEGEGELESPRLTILIRVVEGHRVGWHRTDVPHLHGLEDGLRQALALAKVQPRLDKRPLFPSPSETNSPLGSLRDPKIAELTPQNARQLLRSWGATGESSRLIWSESRLTICNSRGLRRAAVTTEASLEVRSDGNSRSAASARSLGRLAGPRVFERARRLASRRQPIPPPPDPTPALLSPETVIEVLNTLNIFAFSGRCFLDGTSFLTKHRNIQVFDRQLHLRDDGLCEDGLPFPFDLEGSSKTPVHLIKNGQPSTPALTRQQGAQAGLEPTAQAVGGPDALFGNLFLRPGDCDEAALLTAADGGVWIGWIEPPECFVTETLAIRTIARGLRRIEGGQLGAPLPDCVWEDNLLRVLARLTGVGRKPVVLSTPSTPLGAISAPALALAEIQPLVPVV